MIKVEGSLGWCVDVCVLVVVSSGSPASPNNLRRCSRFLKETFLYDSVTCSLLSRVSTRVR